MQTKVCLEKPVAYVVSNQEQPRGFEVLFTWCEMIRVINGWNVLWKVKSSINLLINILSDLRVAIVW